MADDLPVSSGPFRNPEPTPEVVRQREREAAWARVERETTAQIAEDSRRAVRRWRALIAGQLLAALVVVVLVALAVADLRVYGPLVPLAIALGIALLVTALHSIRLRGRR